MCCNSGLKPEGVLNDLIREKDFLSKTLTETSILLQNKARDFSILRRIIGALRFLPDLSKVHLTIVGVVIEEIEAENCSLMVLKKDTNVLAVRAAKGKKDKTAIYYKDESFTGNKFKLGKGIAGKVALEGVPLLVQDTKEEKQFVGFEESRVEVRSLLCVPIKDNTGVIGVFNLSHSIPKAFSDKDKELLVIIASLAAAALNSAGLFEALQRLNKTLEEKIKMETEKVKAYEGKYRALVQNANDGIFVLEDGVFVFTNRKFQEMVKYAEEELNLKNPEMVFPSDPLGLFFQRVKGIGHKGELPTHFELSIVSKGSEKLEVEVSVSIISYNGKKAIQCIVRDITSRRELERMKSNFLAMAAHELRSPLTLINGYNRMLFNEEVGPLNDSQKNILAECTKSGKRLHIFANEVLELSKIQSGKMNFDFKEGDISECIESCLKQLVPSAKEKRVKLKVKCSQEVPVQTLDKNKIERVLINLAENAIKFSPDGGKVEIESILASPDVVEVSITDYGLGIPHDEKELIFDEFMVGRKGESRGGTGLGLAICKKIIEAHGGRIWIESGEKEGSRFIFTLPILHDGVRK